jgi:predicted dehydrogenase
MKPSYGDRLGVAVIGAGYWGPNLVRNLTASEHWDVRWVCDLDKAKAERCVGRYSTVGITSSLDEVLKDETVQAVAVATSPATHGEIGLACLETGRHVLIEKPLAWSLSEGERLVEVAKDRGLVLMCDHTYCYTPAVQRIRQYVEQGELGDLQYVDSVRINLGILQKDIDVLWDLAPHDLSIFDYVLPEENEPMAVAAHGADPLATGKVSIAYLTLPLAGGALAHAHVNWLSPTKVRTMIIGGSRKMLVWDDLHPTQRLSLYDKGVDLSVGLDADARRQTLIAYRTGDVVAPALAEFEALEAVVGEFARAILEDRAPLTDGNAGLRVLRLLTAGSKSMSEGGTMVSL